MCRTAVLGGHVQRCPNGHIERVWYNSCRHRACPQCNGLAKEQWLERTRARLLDCAHWHVVFTIAHQLNVLWMLKKAVMMDALFAAARDTLLELLGDTRYLGAQAGMLLALHTWNRDMGLHTHIHALVSEVGVKDGQWVTPKRSHFLPARVAMCLFRGKLLARLRALHRAGALRLPEELSAERLVSLINRLGRKVKWNMLVCERYAHARGLSVYLARYTKGAPFANSQIAYADQTQVIFRYSPHAHTGQDKAAATLKLSPESFIARMLAHVPEPACHTLRYYGLYAHAKNAELNAARALHGQQPAAPPEPIQWQDYLARFPRALAAAHCPLCHARLMRAALIAPRRVPP